MAAGLARAAPPPYLSPMSFFARMSPIRAVRDLRTYLAGRPPYELIFLMGAIVITAFFIYLFARNDYGAPPYEPDIIYVQQWPANRTDAEIRAAQKIDQKVKEKRLAEEKAAQEKKQAEFKKLDDALDKWGI